MIWFKTIAKNAVGATAEVANVFQMPGRYCTAEGTRLKPSPIDNDKAIIIIFLRDIFISLSTLSPAADHTKHYNHATT